MNTAPVAACTQPGVDPAWFFPPEGAGQHRSTLLAKAVCRECPIRVQCLADALAHERGHGIRHRHGIYGGTTPVERRLLDQSPPRQRTPFYPRKATA